MHIGFGFADRAVPLATSYHNGNCGYRQYLLFLPGARRRPTVVLRGGDGEWDPQVYRIRHLLQPNVDVYVEYQASMDAAARPCIFGDAVQNAEPALMIVLRERTQQVVPDN